jgi:hypothetical protein
MLMLMPSPALAMNASTALAMWVFWTAHSIVSAGPTGWVMACATHASTAQKQPMTSVIALLALALFVSQMAVLTASRHVMGAPVSSTPPGMGPVTMHCTAVN